MKIVEGGYKFVKRGIQKKVVDAEISICDGCKYMPMTKRDIRSLGYRCYKGCDVTYFIKQCSDYVKETSSDIYIPETHYRAPLIGEGGIGDGIESVS